MAKNKNEENTLNLDNILFNCRDYLRAARNSGSFFEKRDMMLTLVFLRFIGEKYEDMQALLDDIQKLYDKFHEEYSLVYFEDKFDPDRKERIAFIGDKKDRFSTNMVIGTITDTYNGVVKHQLWMSIIPNIVDLCEYLGIKFKPEYD